jgi:hypothetical protein
MVRVTRPVAMTKVMLNVMKDVTVAVRRYGHRYLSRRT